MRSGRGSDGISPPRNPNDDEAWHRASRATAVNAPKAAAASARCGGPPGCAKAATYGAPRPRLFILSVASCFPLVYYVIAVVLIARSVVPNGNQAGLPLEYFARPVAGVPGEDSERHLRAATWFRLNVEICGEDADANGALIDFGAPILARLGSAVHVEHAAASLSSARSREAAAAGWPSFATHGNGDADAVDSIEGQRHACTASVDDGVELRPGLQDLGASMRVRCDEVGLARLLSFLVRGSPPLPDGVPEALRRGAGSDAPALLQSLPVSAYPLWYVGAAELRVSVAALWPFVGQVAVRSAFSMRCNSTAPELDDIEEDELASVDEGEGATAGDESVRVYSDGLLHPTSPSAHAGGSVTLFPLAMSLNSSAGTGPASGSSWHRGENATVNASASMILVAPHVRLPPIFVDSAFIPSSRSADSLASARPVSLVSAWLMFGANETSSVSAPVNVGDFDVHYTGHFGAGVPDAENASVFVSAINELLNVSAARASAAGWGLAPRAAADSRNSMECDPAGTIAVSLSAPSTAWCIGCDKVADARVPPPESCRIMRSLSRLVLSLPWCRRQVAPFGEGQGSWAAGDGTNLSSTPESRNHLFQRRRLEGGDASDVQRAVVGSLMQLLTPVARQVRQKASNTLRRLLQWHGGGAVFGTPEPVSALGQRRRRTQDDAGATFMGVRVNAVKWVDRSSEAKALNESIATILIDVTLVDQAVELHGSWPAVSFELIGAQGSALTVELNLSATPIVGAAESSHHVQVYITLRSMLEWNRGFAAIVSSVMDGTPLPVGWRFRAPQHTDDTPLAPGLYTLLSAQRSWFWINGTSFGQSLLTGIARYFDDVEPSNDDEVAAGLSIEPAVVSGRARISVKGDAPVTLPNVFFAGIDADGGGSVRATASVVRDVHATGYAADEVAPLASFRGAIKRFAQFGSIVFSPSATLVLRPNSPSGSSQSGVVSGNGNATKVFAAAVAAQVPVRLVWDFDHHGFGASPAVALPVAQSCCYDAAPAAVARMTASVLGTKKVTATAARGAASELLGTDPATRLPVCPLGAAGSRHGATPGLELGVVYEFTEGQPGAVLSARASANSYAAMRQGQACEVLSSSDVSPASLVSLSLSARIGTELTFSEPGHCTLNDIGFVLHLQNEMPLSVAVTVPGDALSVLIDTCALMRSVMLHGGDEQRKRVESAFSNPTVAARSASFAQHTNFSLEGCGLMPLARLPTASSGPHTLRAASTEYDVQDPRPRSQIGVGTGFDILLRLGDSVESLLGSDDCAGLAEWLDDCGDADCDGPEAGSVAVDNDVLAPSLVLHGYVDVAVGPVSLAVPVGHQPALGCQRLQCRPTPTFTVSNQSATADAEGNADGQRSEESGDDEAEAEGSRLPTFCVQSFVEPDDGDDASEVSLGMTGASWVWAALVVCIPCVAWTCFCCQLVTKEPVHLARPCSKRLRPARPASPPSKQRGGDARYAALPRSGSDPADSGAALAQFDRDDSTTDNVGVELQTRRGTVGKSPRSSAPATV